MDAVTFPDKRVVAFATDNFLSMRVDAGKGEGVDLAQRYHITGYPTIIFARAEGGEVDRIIGFRPPEDFLEEVARITDGTNTLESIRAEIADDPHNLDASLRYGWKMDEREMYTEALDVWRSVQLLSKDDTTEHRLASFKIAEASAMSDTLPDALLDYMATSGENEYTTKAMRGVVNIHRSRRDTLTEAASYKELADFAVRTEAATYRLMNSYAWRMTKLEQNLDDALERIRLGLALA
ncbi:MAG: hypothetical protein V3W14_06645, partial [Candidatus Neomarinimicrobiota bacterium]